MMGRISTEDLKKKYKPGTLDRLRHGHESKHPILAIFVRSLKRDGDHICSSVTLVCTHI